MSTEISIEEALAFPSAKFIDVRSEGEYSEATIPGAINIPLLRNEDRVKVGTTYKQVGTEEAKNLGLELVSPRLPEMIKEIQEYSAKGPVVVFCWRGGMRSQSVCSLLGIMGVDTYRLNGGYKAYRRFVNDYLAAQIPHKVFVLHGLTGVGKTELLEGLRQSKFPAIDLEGLANNRGSVFGKIGMNPQPSQKMFESLLVEDLLKFEPQGAAIVECESKRVGRIILPASLTDAMKIGGKIHVYSSLESRIERIIRIYSDDSAENNILLKEAITSLNKRLGNEKTNELCEMLDTGHIREVVAFLLVEYYDPLYRYPSEPSEEYDLSVDATNLNQALEEIKDYLSKRIHLVT